MCCTIKKETVSSVKEFDILKSKFDVVEIEDKEKYRLLTLKDKASSNKSNIQWIVWLQIKVCYGYSTQHGSDKSNNEMLQTVCKNITDWVDNLIHFEKESTNKQLSLFEEDNSDEIILEDEPESPGADGNWNKYFKEQARVRKSNLIKQYSFFELCNLTDSTGIYLDMDYRHLLPKTNKEMIELVKDAIVKGTSATKGYGRFDDYWWDDEYGWLTRDGALSDIELINRVQGLIRIYFVPYQREFHVSTDMSYSANDYEKRTTYRFWFDGKKINYYGSFDKDKEELPSFELYDLEFIQWLRDHFNIEYKEVISDKDILKINVKSYINSMLWYEKDNYDFIERIKTFKNYKLFKSDILNYCKAKNIDSTNGGGSGASIDGFSGSYDKSKKGKITIVQNIDERINLNRSVENLERDSYWESDVIVYNLIGDDIYKEAFNLFNEINVPVQLSLFDDLLAA